MSWFSRLLMALLLGAATPAFAQDASLAARLEALAGQGNAEAAYHLGMIHHLGLEGVDRDPRRAFDYFRRAADGGNPLGAYKLGCFYAGQGDGVVEDDPDLALRYKLAAAEAGYVLAQMDVAQIYADRGDSSRALHWYDAAARQGDWTALFMAFFRVMPDAPHANRPRAWLYYRAMMDTLERMPASEMSGDEERELEAVRAEMQRFVETGMTESDRTEGQRLRGEWRVRRNPVTIRAREGLDAARRLAGIPAEG